MTTTTLVEDPFEILVGRIIEGGVPTPSGSASAVAWEVDHSLCSVSAAALKSGSDVLLDGDSSLASIIMFNGRTNCP